MSRPAPGRCLVGILAVAIAPLGWATPKDPPDGWPEITPEERALKSVPQDPEADAVILITERSGKIVRKADDTVNVMNYHWRLKVLNERGKRFGAVHIPEQKYSRVDALQARTIKPDGTIVPVPESGMFERVVHQSGGFRRTERVFNFPAVEPGAILEYRYQRHDNNLLFIDPWYFEAEEFTLRSVVSQAVPWSMIYSILRQNCGEAQPLTTDWRDGKEHGRLFTMELRDVPGTHDEIDMPPRRVVSAHLEMLQQAWLGRYSEALGRQDRLFIDWASVARYSRFFYHEAAKKGQSALKGLVEEWTRGIADPRERIKTVVRHVRRDFAYLPYGSVFGSSRSLESILADRSADNEEKAVLLAAALKALGVDSWIALVSGKDKGGLLNPKFFSLSQFTHAVVALPGAGGTMQWIDPTITYAPFDFMSWKDSGAGALLLKNDQGELVHLPDTSTPSATKYKVTVTVNADGGADLAVEAEYLGEDAVDRREDLAPAAETARLSYLQAWLAAKRPGAALRSHSIENLEEVDRPLRISMQIDAPDLLTTAEGVLLIRACVLSCVDSNPISAGGRRYPFFVDRERREEEEVLLEPAPGMRAGETPAPIIAQSDLATLTFHCAEEEHGAVRCSRQLLLRKVRLPANAQGGIRAMYDTIVDADRTTIPFEETGAAGAAR
ncbi:MAG TPA: DUF3857 domain-containing protein [Candidatus Polarisedimenticolia bacterium]|nr:DUF3857 domain-containing protein [Candidatus Polarisedimenticolia bacterium]